MSETHLGTEEDFDFNMLDSIIYLDISDGTYRGAKEFCNFYGVSLEHFNIVREKAKKYREWCS